MLFLVSEDEAFAFNLLWESKMDKARRVERDKKSVEKSIQRHASKVARKKMPAKQMLPGWPGGMGAPELKDLEAAHEAYDDNPCHDQRRWMFI